MSIFKISNQLTYQAVEALERYRRVTEERIEEARKLQQHADERVHSLQDELVKLEGLMTEIDIEMDKCPD